MLKTRQLRKLLPCLMFGIIGMPVIPIFAQGFGEGRRDRSEFDGSFNNGASDGNSGGGGYEGGGMRRWGGRGGDFGGGEGRFGGGSGRWGGGEGRFGGGDGSWGGRGGFNPGEEPASPGQQYQNAPTATPTSMRPRERVTIELPAAYLEADRDGDRQIGLYEWRQWRRGDMASFLALDHNGDGFLTPAELTKGPRSSNLTNASGGIGTPTGTTPPSTSPTGTPAIPASAGSGTQDPAATGTSSSPSAAAMLGRFGLLDQNRNGQVDPEEWGRSKTMKPQFEAAGFNLTVPMSKDDFIKNAMQLNANK